MVGHMLHRIMQGQMAQLHWAFKPQIGNAHYEEFLDLTFENSEKLIQLVTASNTVEAEEFWADHMDRVGKFFFQCRRRQSPLRLSSHLIEPYSVLFSAALLFDLTRG